MDPEEAAAKIAVLMKNLFPLIGEKARLEFVNEFLITKIQREAKL